MEPPLETSANQSIQQPANKTIENKVPGWLKTLVIGQAVIIVVLLVLFLYLSVKGTTSKTSNINSYDECVAAGGAIMESYPEQCMTEDKRTFTRVLSEDEQQNLDSPDETTSETEAELPSLDELDTFEASFAAEEPVLE